MLNRIVLSLLVGTSVTSYAFAMNNQEDDKGTHSSGRKVQVGVPAKVAQSL